jgi:hypothetical protein
MATNRTFIRHPRRSALTHEQEQELWLGPDPRHGSLFRSRAELEQAWLTHRDHMMERYGKDGRRPQAWWEFEGAALGLTRDYNVERSVLYRAGLLDEAEAREVVTEWRQEFEKAWRPDFVVHSGGRILKGETARARHFAWADIPAELVEAWEAEREQGVQRHGVPEPGEAAASPEPAA